MATARDMRVGSYCSRVYEDLTAMKATVTGFIEEIREMKGPEKELLAAHITHFEEIARMLDWKLEIVTKACPYEWTGYTGVETGPLVELQNEYLGTEVVSGGYIGG